MKIRVLFGRAEARVYDDATHWKLDGEGHLLVKRSEDTIALYERTTWTAVEVIEDE